MSDAKQRPDATPDQKPQNQAGEDAGTISGPQVTGHSIKRKDLPRGSEGDTRRAAGNRS